ncbi:MAG TPA: ATP-binding protein [Dictyobacter sp.]|jgi:two-component system OmpR family sensor kinase|nr:ATP-binding protein [Dictyobacter sp.]
MRRLLPLTWPPGVRIQVALWYTVVFALILMLSDVIFFLQLRESMIDNMDSMLQIRAQQIASGISDINGKITVQNILYDTSPDAKTKHLEQAVDENFGSLIRILTPQGKVLQISPTFQTLVVPKSTITQPLKGQAWHGTIETKTNQDTRFYSVALSENGNPFVIIQIGESMSQMHMTLKIVLLELFLLAPPILLLGALGSYWLATRAFKPIDHLTRTAQKIKEGDLHERVVVPPTHDEVQALALTLNEMLASLEATVTRQRRFVADASHELRTPVAALRSMTETLLFANYMPQDAITLLQNMNIETERLGRLISDLLALARVDEGQTRLEQELVYLDTLTRAVVTNAEPLATRRHITVQVDTSESVVICGDEARIIQVVMNLLDNAILYTPEGGQVNVAVRKQQGQVYLSIQDTGVGIAPEHLPHIFERFYRVDQARMRKEGTSSGLGLSIVDWIVHAHKGTIQVESVVNQGSTFTITLPLATCSSSSHAGQL